MPELETNGYLYVAYGDKHIEECLRSVASLRKYTNLPICLISDQDYKVDKWFEKNVIDSSIAFRGGKIIALTKSPFSRTFFVDSDTYFCESCDSGFGLLDYYDACMAGAPNEYDIVDENLNHIEGHRPLNSGVILFRHSFDIVLSKAFELYQTDLYPSVAPSNRFKRDQPFVSLAIMKSSCRVHVLPSIWNFRPEFFVDLKGKVKIIHGRVDFEETDLEVNKILVQRCWNPMNKKVIYQDFHHGKGLSNKDSISLL